MLFSGQPPAPDQNLSDDPETAASTAGRESWSAWLDRNERETWQMELLISGFAIVLLSQAIVPLTKHLNALRANVGDSDLVEGLVLGATVILVFGILIIGVSLLLNVLLRGLWIAALGLRSVSGDIDYEALRMAPVFDTFLRRRLGRFDDYIIRLERLCSVVYSLAFITSFALLGLVGLVLAITLPTIAVAQAFPNGPPNWFLIGGAVALNLVFVLAIIYAIDFVSGGRLKRVRAISRVYYPVYRVFGWLTMARMYRPLYYNLVDIRLGRALVLLVIPYFIILATLLEYDGAHLTPLTLRNMDFGFGSSGAYGVQDADYFPLPFLGNMIASNDYIELYAPIEWQSGDLIVSQCESEGLLYQDAVRSRAKNFANRYESLQSLVGCISGKVTLRIDARVVPDPSYVIVEYEQSELSCLFTTIRTDSLARGAHYLSVFYQVSASKEEVHQVTIPFVVP